MKKVYILKGLNCPNCAAKIEREASEIDGVKSAAVNLMNETITVNISPEAEDSFLSKLTELVHNHEPDVDVISKDEKTISGNENGGFTASLLRLIIGAAIFLFGIILSWILEDLPAAGLLVLIAAYIILGFDVISKALGNIIKGHVFDENFLMTLSTVGAFCIGEYHEAVAVMLFYQIGELFQDYSVRRSRRSIADLMDIRPEYANVMRDGKLIKVSPEDVYVGDTVIIKPGERIPLDGNITEGSSTLDMAALTGESVPQTVNVGDTVLSGSINQNGVISVKVTKPYEDSTVANILELVENASARKAPTENFITVFARYYTPAVVIASLLLGVIPPLFFDGVWSEWLRRAMVFLVVSCPCALVISVPLAFFGGIGTASRHGILVKGANYLEALDKAETVVFDKTGTLTKGRFAVSEISPVNGTDKNELIKYAAEAEYYSNHPIARSILSEYGKEIDGKRITDYAEISGKGVTAVVDGKQVTAGNASLLREKGISFPVNSSADGTTVYVALDVKYIGSVTISDEIKTDSASAITEMKRAGIRRTVMLTGDNAAIAEEIAEKLGIDEYHAELLPADKVSHLAEISGKNRGGKTVFVGDGINDAPVISMADVGIAMGALGSDAAIEAADVVLMTDEVSKVAKAIKIAHRTKLIVIENIVFSLFVKCIFLVLGAFGIAGMWEAVFGDVGVALIAVLNSMRILKYKC